MTTVHKILNDAADLLEEPDAWVAGLTASDEFQEYLFNSGSPLATCWDIIGAIEKSSPTDLDGRDEAINLVIEYLGLKSARDLEKWNDAQEDSRIVSSVLRSVAIEDYNRMAKVDSPYGAKEKGTFSHRCWQLDTSISFFGPRTNGGKSLSSLHSNPEAAKLRRARIFHYAMEGLGNRIRSSDLSRRSPLYTASFDLEDAFYRQIDVPNPYTTTGYIHA